MEHEPLVLIIDDSSINIILLCNLLEEQSYRVVSTNNGEDGFALAKQYSPDLILLDIAMPGWDGYHTCQCLKQDRAMEKIPILFLSALDDAKNKVRALQVGGVDYIVRLVRPNKLSNSVT